MLFWIRTLPLVAAALLALGAADARALLLTGTLTNTTVEAAAPARLTLTLAGEIATATLVTEPPLRGTGKLEGRFLHGWLELQGKLADNITVQFRGALNAHDYRGTYLASTPGQPVQYGKFHLTIAK